MNTEQWVEDRTAGRGWNSRQRIEQQESRQRMEQKGIGWNSRQRLEKQAKDLYRIAGIGLNSRQWAEHQTRHWTAGQRLSSSRQRVRREEKSRHAGLTNKPRTPSGGVWANRDLSFGYSQPRWDIWKMAA
jgi:hypothetical protein